MKTSEDRLWDSVGLRVESLGLRVYLTTPLYTTRPQGSRDLASFGFIMT